MTDVVAQWQGRIRDAASRRSPLRIRGGGTKDFYGEAPAGEVLDTRELTGVVDYDPTELVITARAGTPLAEIERVMGERGQMLAFEPPHFGPHATLGGAIAAGLAGPRRPYAGAPRDVVLGVRMLDGQGTELGFGGRVMKNVAGFDVSRVMAGAMGTLGILLDVSLKCLPLPRREASFVLDASPAEAIRRMNEWSTKPFPISATCHCRNRIHVRLSGAAPAIDSAARAIGGTPLDNPAPFWEAVREQTLPEFVDATELWRLSVRSTAPHLDIDATQVIEWGGALRWVASSTPLDAQRLRTWAAEQGGHATLFRAERKSVGVFQPLPAPIAEIHRRLKAAFDPSGVLNPGRLYPDV